MLMGSALGKQKKHTLAGTWINQDEFSHLGKGAKKAFLAAILVLKLVFSTYQDVKTCQMHSDRQTGLRAIWNSVALAHCNRYS